MRALIGALCLVGCGSNAFTSEGSSEDGGAGGNEALGGAEATGGALATGGAPHGGMAPAGGSMDASGGAASGGAMMPTGGAPMEECITLTPGELYEPLTPGCYVGTWDILWCSGCNAPLRVRGVELPLNEIDAPGPFRIELEQEIPWCGITCFEAPPECVWNDATTDWDCP